MEKDMEKYREAQMNWLESTTIKEFKEAVEKAASTEAVNPSPNQCLIVLRLEGEWLKCLLDIGADPNKEYEVNVKVNALMMAALENNTEVMSLLVEYGADVHKFVGTYYSPIHCAARCGHVEAIEFLLKKGVSIDHCNESIRGTPLMVANIFQKTKSCSYLIQHGATLDFQNNDGQSALALVCEMGFYSMAKLLLEGGANPNLQSNYGSTPLSISCYEVSPLHYACIYGSDDIVHLLLKASANPNAVTTEGLAPLAIAAEKGRIKVVEMLLSEGADIEVADFCGWTPIFYAAAAGQLDMIRLLLQHGAKIKKDKFGEPIESIAAKVGRIKIKSLLQEATKQRSEKKDEAAVSKEQERKDEPKEVTSSAPTIPVEVTSTALTTPVEVDTESSEETTKPSPLINEDDQQSTDNSFSHYQKIRIFISSSIGSIKQQYYDNTIKRLKHQMEAMESTIAEQLKLLSIS
uniref:Uncharacterized protein n=1 Tax=Amphimedon queenslandica TaxID=400682 RepID=A0A1X7TCE2_AMPQE